MADQVMLAGAPWYSRPVEDVAAALQVDTTIGLPAGEVAARLERHGPNRLPRQPPPGPLSLLLRQFTSLLVYILLFAAGLSLALGDWLEFAAIIVIAVLNGVLGFVQEHRAEQALSALESLSVPTATVLRDGASQTVATEDVVPGDVLLLEEGDIVAADARLIAAIALSANEALLTGESVPVDKVVEARPAPTPLAEQDCLVFQGTQIARGRGRAIAVRTGASSEMGRIASNVLAQPQEETPLQHELHRVGRVLAIAAGVLCLGVFIIGIARGIDTDKMLLTAASLSVAAIPEGLPAASTVVLALGVQRMASRSALVRRLSSVETLGSVTMVFTDKTGTLTQNRMRVEETWLAGSERDFLNVARFCNNAELAEKSDAHRGDPTEIALLDYVRQHDGPSYSSTGYERRLEMPFTADRARMTVVMELPDGAALLVFTKGATGRVLERCSLVGASPATDELRRQVTDRASEMARSGLRVLALAQRALHEEASDAEQIETGLTLVGLAGMADPLRPEAKEAVRRAQEAGIQVVMLTGDQRETAASIGTAVGIEGEIATGGELDQLGPDHLPARLSATRIFARVTSDHKLQIIRAARRQGHVVAMTGDGVNDAPALRAADIGIAMGIQGTPVAREASDLVLADDNFATIVAAIEEGRTIHANIRRFIHFLLACNTAEIAVVFLLLAWAVDPVLTPLQILFVNLLTDGLPALALGVEPAGPGVMQQPPRPRGRGLISTQSLLPIIGLGGAVAFASLAAYWLGRTWEAEGAVVSMTFATLVGAQLAVSLVFRSETESVLRLPRNFWLLGALVASVLALLAVFYVPVLQDAFEVQPMSLERWLAVALLSLAPLLAGELVKASGLLRRFDLAPRES